VTTIAAIATAASALSTAVESVRDLAIIMSSFFVDHTRLASA
jgi:hypothetical protein